MNILASTGNLTTPYAFSVQPSNTTKVIFAASSIAQEISEPTKIKIAKGFMFGTELEGTLFVRYPFSLHLQSTEDGFVATSPISDIFELGETKQTAIWHYLVSLLEELHWFQEHNLSQPLLKDFEKLRSYVDLV